MPANDSEEHVWKISPRPGIEFYVCETGHVAIKQIDSEGRGGDIVTLHPDDLPKLIESLDELHASWADGGFCGPDGIFGNEKHGSPPSYTTNGHAK